MFGLFKSKKSTNDMELKKETIERMVRNFERRINLMNFTIGEFKKDREEALEKGLTDVVIEKEANIKCLNEKLEEIRKEFQKEIFKLTA